VSCHPCYKGMGGRPFFRKILPPDRVLPSML